MEINNDTRSNASSGEHSKHQNFKVPGLVSGFSKLNRNQRIDLLNTYLDEDAIDLLNAFLLPDEKVQQVISELSENFLSNYYLPFGVVPNVLINGQMYMVPMVIEESSVVAAASRAAGFWAKNGGFSVRVIDNLKKGQVHFTWSGSERFLKSVFLHIKEQILADTAPVTANMELRGGGIVDVELLSLSHKLENYYQLDVTFKTADAMGANFINTCLETMAVTLSNFMSQYSDKGQLEIIMSILSNYTPQCLVECTVTCPVEKLEAMSGAYLPQEFARRFALAIKMAQVDVSRAVTHNKGIYNGIDGVVLATGNDWRAIEAAGHAFAARKGTYSALSDVEIVDGYFKYTISLPLAVGTVGGLTKNHPIAAFALKMLRNPSANSLMQITAAMGMANNFSAVASLVTSGIQKGHMKMHLANMLNQLGASDLQKEAAGKFFANKTVSYAMVSDFLKKCN
jgi:hydroxymethylglutaryl-CoA reductase